MGNTNKKNKKNSRKLEWLNTLALILIVIIIVGGAILIIYQSINPPSASANLGLASLKENWGSMQTSAKNWKNDAFLWGVEYDITDKPVLIAKFESPSDLKNELIITITKDQQPEVKPIALGFETVESKPITQENFSVDARQALDAMMKDDAVTVCINSEKTVKQLSMESDMTGYPVWTLSMVNCPSTGRIKTVYVNAQTGNVFNPPSKATP